MGMQNRIALVTGAARGIGLAIAHALLDAGNRVVVTDMSAPALNLFKPEHHDRIMAIPLDVRDKTLAAKVLDEVHATWGPVGILVNNAGISPKIAGGRSATLKEITTEEWETVIDVNLTSILCLCQLAVPHMKEQNWGRIVNISSLAGRARNLIAGASYSASKAGVIGMSRVLGSELGPSGITVNCVAPGRILTPMALLAAPGVNEAYAEQIPVRRLGKPEEVGALVAFLASEGTGFINGAIVDINGGYFMP